MSDATGVHALALWGAVPSVALRQLRECVSVSAGPGAVYALEGTALSVLYAWIVDPVMCHT